MSGQVVQAVSSATFTPHRSPLGLIFDTDNPLADFTGDAFTLSYSAGGGVRGGYLFTEDSGEDMLHIRLQYDPATDNFTARTTKVADRFIYPTDAERVGNVIYVIEEGRQAIWKLTFKPLNPASLADLSLTMSNSSLVAVLNKPVSVTLTVRNDGPAEARQIQIENQLPPFMAYAGGALTNTNGVLTGTLASLGSGQQAQFVYQLMATRGGNFRNAAQLLATGTPDPDSQPGSGTADGQDDTVLVTLHTSNGNVDVFTSPNLHQQPLPAPGPNQPTPDPNKADMSLQLTANTLTPHMNGLILLTVVATNQGGQPATSVTVEHTLPDQMTFVSGTGWTQTGQVLRGQLPTIPAGGQATLTFQARVTGSGRLVDEAQINTATPADPDSTPGNGLTTGEDDTARLELRTR